MELLHLAPETQNFHCPYNVAHTMPQKKLTKHLNRCPDKPPHFRHCIYNISHVMPETDLKNHEENCPDRILIDVAIYEAEDMARPDSHVENVPSVKYEESWDGLEQTSEILKTIKIKTTSMKATHNITRSERKQHRINLHENDINNVDDKDEKKQQNKKMDTTPLFIGKRPNT
ncbi:unnamed protein product [Macrosiphum euphorbiae]|uniref:CHHC U11-48K-type domain-containing protein n=1 Tax=Macrosiphum euphorbiae TaxID=13131 RepID=A0AAV0WAS0_9HEMI|nr:unnamed protein product [Macrosiphum euphorbiae]